jgi:hypothetical protein
VAKKQTYLVHVRLCEKFEDLYVEATSPEAAIAAAKKLTTLNVRWARFVI